MYIIQSTTTGLLVIINFILLVTAESPHWPPYSHRNLSISESAQIGAKFILETAVDPDGDLLSYEIVSAWTLSKWQSDQTSGKPSDANREPESLLAAYNNYSSNYSKDNNNFDNNLNITASSSSSSSSLSNTDRTVDDNSEPRLTTSLPSSPLYFLNAPQLPTVSTSLSSIPFKLVHNISSSFLHLEVIDTLDRETQSNYLLNISATDISGQSAYLPLYIQILDVNDNPPIFDHSDYSVSLNESVGSGVAVIQVRASDADEDGSNSAITYSLLSNDYFTVDPVTGMIYTKREDFIECGQLNNHKAGRVCVFNVLATDLGTPAQIGRAYVTVNILDANDHNPVIRFLYLSLINGTISEDALINSVVAAIAVEDADHGPNGQTSLQIVSGNELGHFRLESIDSTHIIRVNSSLGSKVSSYNLTLVAQDFGSPPQSSKVNLVISVKHVSNQPLPPSSSTAYLNTVQPEAQQIFVSESSSIGHDVFDLSAVKFENLDAKSKKEYKLINCSPCHESTFRVDPFSGKIILQARIISAYFFLFYFFFFCYLNNKLRIYFHIHHPIFSCSSQPIRD